MVKALHANVDIWEHRGGPQQTSEHKYSIVTMVLCWNTKQAWQAVSFLYEARQVALIWSRDGCIILVHSCMHRLTPHFLYFKLVQSSKNNVKAWEGVLDLGALACYHRLNAEHSWEHHCVHEHYFQIMGIYHLVKSNTSHQAAIVNAQTTSDRLHSKGNSIYSWARKAAKTKSALHCQCSMFTYRKLTTDVC